MPGMAVRLDHVSEMGMDLRLANVTVAKGHNVAVITAVYKLIDWDALVEAYVGGLVPLVGRYGNAVIGAKGIIAPGNIAFVLEILGFLVK